MEKQKARSFCFGLKNWQEDSTLSVTIVTKCVLKATNMSNYYFWALNNYFQVKYFITTAVLATVTFPQNLSQTEGLYTRPSLQIGDLYPISQREDRPLEATYPCFPSSPYQSTKYVSESLFCQEPFSQEGLQLNDTAPEQNFYLLSSQVSRKQNL